MKPQYLFLQRIGSNFVPIDRAEEQKARLWPEMRMLKFKVSIPRRQRNHAHFFAAIAAATDHWPEGHEPEPKGNSERLRSWLLCKSGYCEHIDFPVEAATAVVALMQRFAKDEKHCFVRPGTVGGVDTLRVFIPKSIAWDELDETSFVEIKQAVFSTIHAIIGVPADELVRGSQEAA